MFSGLNPFSIPFLMVSSKLTGVVVSASGPSSASSSHSVSYGKYNGISISLWLIFFINDVVKVPDYVPER